MKRVISQKPSPLSKPLSKKNSLKIKPLKSFEKRVLALGRAEALWHKEATLVLGLSGGADSTALLQVFLALKNREHFRLVVAHVNYNLRGKESTGDRDFVKHLATKHSLPFHVLNVARTKVKKDEATLRALRYTFFSKVLRKEKADAVVLGHHRDDQAETFLLRLLRGSGAVGLRAMQPKRDHYIRPFLFATRAEIYTYLKSKKVSFRTDSSNTDSRYLRNKIRHELIPLLAKEYQPQIVNILANTATRLSEAPVDTATLHSVALIENKGSLTFSLEQLLSLPSNTRTALLRHILSTILLNPVSNNLSREIEKVLKGTKNKVSEISFRGLKITKKGGTVTLQKISLD